MDGEILNSPPTQIQTPIPQSSSQISMLNSVAAPSTLPIENQIIQLLQSINAI